MLSVARRTLTIASITVALVGCRDGTAPNEAARYLGTRPSMADAPGDPAPLVPHIVAPKTTDPAIDRALAPHYVWFDPAARANRKLLLFMPGANNQPVSWQLLAREAARLGYHVIALMYQNDVAVVQVCTGSSIEPGCSEKIRLEVLDGIDRTKLVDVTPSNSIDNRLTKLLVHLDANFPDEEWSQFLEDGAPDWRRIVVSGQSQGAGQAALIAKLRRVDRVVMFSGPPDARVATETDPWVAIGETPAAKYFALFHDKDHLVAGIRANLDALGLSRFADPVRVEANVPPYGDTHVLFTNLTPQKGCAMPNPHQSTARDDNTPLGTQGVPRLRAAWRYVLGAHDTDDASASDDGPECATTLALTP
jgi:hypothetical protein